MGHHYGLINHTRNQWVSGRWKDMPWCNFHEVMHIFGWEVTDMITSASYQDIYFFIHNEEDNAMSMVELYNNDGDPLAIIPDLVGEPIKMGFYETYSDDTEKTEVTLSEHAPMWKDGVCVKCGHTPDIALIEELKDSFNEVFFRN